MRKKVLLIGVLPKPVGGISIHIQRLAAHLEKRGFDCACLDESREPKPGIPNVRRIGCLRYVRMVRSADIVHVHTSHSAARLLHVVGAKALGRTIVLTTHSLTAPSKSRIARWLYKAASSVADATIYVSEGVRRGMAGRGPVIPAFLPPQMSEKFIRPEIESWIAERRREGRKILVSNASRLNFFKGEDLYGLDLLIDAVAENPTLACVFVVSALDRSGDYFASCQARIHREGLGGRFFLLHADIPFSGLIRLGDAMVRATNTDGDALSVREALWLGKPVVASDCAERPEGVTLFATRDIHSLSTALRHLDAMELPTKSPDFGDAVISVYERLKSR